MNKEETSHVLIEDYLKLMIGRKIGHETAKSFIAKQDFFKRYLSGQHVLEIGYQGAEKLKPIFPHVTGVDLDYDGYDGLHLPFDNYSQDAVYSSHCLEHIEDDKAAIQEWFRVVKIGGYVVVTVPHQFLYERKWEFRKGGHAHFYTPSTLMALAENALPPNHYRLRHLQDNDMFYDYLIQPGDHPAGCYEIEMVLEKITPPSWVLE